MSIIGNLKFEHQMDYIDSNVKMVFKEISEKFMKNNSSLKYIQIEKIVDKLELSENYIHYSIETLKNNNYISYNELGSGGIYNIKLTGKGIISYYVNFIDDYEDIFEKIFSEIFNKPQCTNESISHTLNIYKPIITAIIDYFDKKGYVEVYKTASGNRTIKRVLINLGR